MALAIFALRLPYGDLSSALPKCLRRLLMNCLKVKTNIIFLSATNLFISNCMQLNCKAFWIERRKKKNLWAFCKK